MRDSITKLVSISFLGGLIGRALRYGFNVVIARGLGVEALGIFAFGMVIMKGGGVFARVGLDNAAKKYIPIYRDNDDPARVSGTILLCLGTPFVVGTVIAVVLYFGKGLTEKLVGTTFHATTALFILGIPLIAIMMVGVNATYGLKETKYSVYIRDFGQSIAALVLMAIAAFVVSDLSVLVVGYLLSILIGAVLAIFFLHQENALRLDIKPVFEYRKIFAFSIPLTLVASIQYLVSWTDILVLGVFVSSESVGWYQAAYQTSVLLIVVLQSMNSIFPSIAAGLHKSGQHERLNRLYTAVTKWVTYLTVLGLAYVLVYSQQILSIFGTTVQSAEISLVILAIGQSVAATVGPAGYLLMMTGYERLQVVNTTITAVLNFALNIVLIQSYGIIGAAIATGVSFSILNLLRLAQVWLLLGIQPYSREYWRGAFAILGAALALSLVKLLPAPGYIQLVVGGSIAILIFVATLWSFGLTDEDEILIEAIN
ncbi:archaeal glycosylation protein R [Halolamina pelagica]|uniref:Archaeal glycosylation protein R n=1 Tax=Halolamina pelagica TaxID=699431 RepID=A0A0P7H7R2_9EURY|nr:flippase [Halolamina pelagica]KPN29436.1 archaeal glycosylation protein R [Halolamina pelagica]